MLSRRTGFRLVALMAALLVSFLVGELVVRVVKPQRTYAVLQSMAGSYYAPSPFNPFTLKKNYRGTFVSQQFPGQLVEVTTNSLGLRSPEIEEAKGEETRRILVLGDSFTFGAYVGDQETYPAVLERILRQKGYSVEVLNAGFADGWETDEHYSWLVNRGFDFEPDIVILGFFIGNDIMNIVVEDWLELDSRGLPTRIEDDTFYIDDLGRLRALTHENNRSVGDQMIYRIPGLRNSHVAVLVALSLDRWVRKVYDEPPFGPPEDYSYDHIFKVESAVFDAKEVEFLRLLRGMKAETGERDVDFLVLMIPLNFQVDPRFRLGWIRLFGPIRRNYFQELKPKLDKSSIPYIDLFEKLARKSRYFPPNGEVHFNPEGNEFVASLLAAEILGKGWLGRDGPEATPAAPETSHHEKAAPQKGR